MTYIYCEKTFLHIYFQMSKRKLELVREHENGDRFFQHISEEICTQPGTFSKPILAGIHRSKTGEFCITAKSNDKYYEYVVSRTKESRTGRNSWWNKKRN